MKRFFCIIISLVILLCSGLHIFTAYHSTTYRMSSAHLTLYTYASGTSLLSYQGGDCHYQQLAPSEYTSDIQFDHTIISAAVFGNTVVALCSDVNNDQLEVNLYYPHNNSLDTFAINGIVCNTDPGFYYNGKSLFLINERQINCIEQYDLSGRLIKRYTFTSPVTQLSADYNGNTIAVSSNTLYRLSSDHFTAISGTGITAPITYCSANCFTDASGSVYRSNNTSCDLLFHVQAPFGQSTACIIDSVIYYPNGSRINGYRLSSGEMVSSITLQQPTLGLYAHKGNVVAVSNGASTNVTKIHPNEFTDLTHKQSSNETSGQAPQYNADHTGNHTIESSVYRIDLTAYHISHIPVGTTFAQLKKNIDHEGYTARLYRNGKEIKSGNCGTGMTVVFDSDSASYTFELSVIGDLTGEGNVNSRDLSVMMEYLIDQANLGGVYYRSADLSDDGVIDVKDLALLHRSI